MDSKNDTGGTTVQEAVMERYDKMIGAIDELSSTIYPSTGAEFRIKIVIENLQLIHKMSSEMLKILVAVVIAKAVEDEDDSKEPA